jgi:hypothetical protein
MAPRSKRGYGSLEGGMSEADEEELDFFLMASLRQGENG